MDGIDDCRSHRLVKNFVVFVRHPPPIPPPFPKSTQPLRSCQLHVVDSPKSILRLHHLPQVQPLHTTDSNFDITLHPTFSFQPTAPIVDINREALCRSNAFIVLAKCSVCIFQSILVLVLHPRALSMHIEHTFL